MNQRVTVVTHYRAKEGYDLKLGELLLAVVEPKRSEDGCIECELHQATNNPTSYVSYEIWENREYFDKHNAKWDMAQFRSMAQQLCEESPEKKLWDKKPGKPVKDEQTGVLFQPEEEGVCAWVCANLSYLYLIGALLFLLWVLVTTWLDRVPFLVSIFGGQYAERFKSPNFQLFAYAAIGGSIGAIVSGIRSVYVWHLERRAFGARFILRDLACPVLGAILAIAVYALGKLGFGVINGDIPRTGTRINEVLRAFSVGLLVGYSWHKVFVWLDDLANRILRTKKGKEEASKSETEATDQ